MRTGTRVKLVKEWETDPDDHWNKTPIFEHHTVGTVIQVGTEPDMDGDERIKSVTVRWDNGSLVEYGDDTETSMEVCPNCRHQEESDGYGGNDCPECFSEGVCTPMAVRPPAKHDWGDLHDVTPKLYVNVYLHDRAYGGPEEGGWWYDCYAPVDDECEVFEWPYLAKQAFEKKVEAMKAENEGRRPISSVLSEGQYEVRLEAFPPEAEPSRRPRYC